MEEYTAVTPPKHKFDWSSLLAALIMIIIGVTILIWPSQTGAILVYVVGGLIAVAGIVRAIMYFARKEKASPFSFGGLTIGLTLLAVGAVLLLRPEILKSILPIMLGCLLMFAGLGCLQTAVELARLKVAKWWISLLFALISVACGIIAVADVFRAANTLMVFLGISLVVEGLLIIISLSMFRKKIQD